MVGVGVTRAECAYFLSVMPALHVIHFFRFYHFMSITPYLLLLLCIFGVMTECNVFPFAFLLL